MPYNYLVKYLVSRVVRTSSVCWPDTAISVFCNCSKWLQQLFVVRQETNGRMFFSLLSLYATLMEKQERSFVLFIPYVFMHTWEIKIGTASSSIDDHSLCERSKDHCKLKLLFTMLYQTKHNMWANIWISNKIPPYSNLCRINQ